MIFLKKRLLKRHTTIHCSFEKSIIERAIYYVKDTKKIFDYYFPYGTKKVKVEA
jgi:hypothetical protein